MIQLRNRSRVVYLSAVILITGMLFVPGSRINPTPIPSNGSVAHAAVSKSYQVFIIAAYQGAYGRNPDCASELEPEYYAMVNAAASNALLDECKRFVSTLFETQASFDSGDLSYYYQTSEYESLNSVNNTDEASQTAFVTDLYEAFLQRSPDSDGLAFWTADVMSEGRKKGIVAFEVCDEFATLVDGLYQGSAPSCGSDNCGIPCPHGMTRDAGTCQCVVNCLLPMNQRNPHCEE